MSFIRVLLVAGFIVIGASGCNLFTKPSAQGNTTQDSGSYSWYSKRMNQEQTSTTLHANKPRQ